MLLAVDDGRALPASVLAEEAGVSRPTASSHLGKLTAAGLLSVETPWAARLRSARTERGRRPLEDRSATPTMRTRRPTTHRQKAPGAYCMDWTEQRHHLAGGLGRAIVDRFVAAGWVKCAPRGRAVTVTDTDRTTGPRWRTGSASTGVSARPSCARCRPAPQQALRAARQTSPRPAAGS
ncbi:winged helix-turn-helix domain-containing protein [Mycobacterium sp.]|uniref:winged helix-turn-helix domain-containing protein n=1 Tax=Mycobacterium sp. TaxID=1785 RepID=UPI003340C4FE